MYGDTIQNQVPKVDTHLVSLILWEEEEGPATQPRTSLTPPQRYKV